jgi:hypothetical protein
MLLFLPCKKKKKKKKKLSACRGEGSAVGPLLAVLRCRCAALLVLVLMSDPYKRCVSYRFVLICRNDNNLLTLTTRIGR